MPSTHQTWTSFCICHQLSLLDFDHIDQCKRTTLEQVAWHIFNFITLYFFYISSTFLSTCELKQRVLIRPIRWKIWALSVTVNPSRWAAVDTLKLRLVTAHLFLSSVKMSLKKRKRKEALWYARKASMDLYYPFYLAPGVSFRFYHNFLYANSSLFVMSTRPIIGCKGHYD